MEEKPKSRDDEEPESPQLVLGLELPAKPKSVAPGCLEAAIGPFDPAWDYVQGLAGLRAEPKLGWYTLWKQGGYKPSKVVTSPKAIAKPQGTSEDAGLRYLRRLSAKGLIKILECKGGVWTVSILEPREVLTDCDRTDGQARIRFE